MSNKIVWKDHKPYAVCLTHDVDRVKKQWYHYVVYSRKGINIQLKSFYNKRKGKEPYNNFKRIAELEMQYGAKSTFFFLNESHREFSADFMGRYEITDPVIVEAVQWLDAQGFEIGLHGSFYSYKNEELLKREKEILEKIVGHSVVSVRQHFLNFDQMTWKIQKNIGLCYDSTMGKRKSVCRDFAAFPYYTKEGILEMPITVMDTIPLKSERNLNTVLYACDEIAQKGGLIVLNFHQCHFIDDEYPYVVRLYEKLLQKAKEDCAWMTSMKNIGEWVSGKSEGNTLMLEIKNEKTV